MLKIAVGLVFTLTNLVWLLFLGCSKYSSYDCLCVKPVILCITDLAQLLTFIKMANGVHSIAFLLKILCSSSYCLIWLQGNLPLMSQNAPNSGQYQSQGYGSSGSGYGQPHPPSLFAGMQPAQQFDYGHGTFAGACFLHY
jgi:hypothetical protein